MCTNRNHLLNVLTNFLDVDEMTITFLILVVQCSYYTGNGTLDSFLITKCTPELEHYIGLEPHKPSFDQLSEAMMNFTDIKVRIN